MGESNEQIQRLMLLKSKFETALSTNNRDELVRYFNEFKMLYEEITSKKFEDGIPEEKLKQIESVINGTVTSIEGKNIINDTEDEILI